MTPEHFHQGDDVSSRESRLGINPGPLRVTSQRVQEDPDAGRCEAILRDGSGRCLNDATRDVSGKRLCGVHARFAAEKRHA